MSRGDLPGPERQHGLFGIIGAFLAVPTAAAVAVVLCYLLQVVAIESQPEPESVPVSEMEDPLVGVKADR